MYDYCFTSTHYTIYTRQSRLKKLRSLEISFFLEAQKDLSVTGVIVQLFETV